MRKNEDLARSTLSNIILNFILYGPVGLLVGDTDGLRVVGVNVVRSLLLEPVRRVHENLAALSLPVCNASIRQHAPG